MAKCKLCKNNIPDGTEYCSDCQDKKNSLNNETYLDSLLNSVKNLEPVTEGIYKKKSHNSTNSSTNTKHEHKDDITSLTDTDQTEDYRTQDDEDMSPMDMDLDMQELLSYQVDLSDIQDFEEFDMEEDRNDLQDNIKIGDGELFGNDISDLLNADTEVKTSVNLAEPVTAQKADQYIENGTNNNDKDDVHYMRDKEFQPNDPIIPDETTEESFAEEINKEVYYSNDNQEDDIPDDYIGENFMPNEIEEYNAEEDFDRDLNNLLNNLDTFQDSNFEEEMLGNDSGYEAKQAETMEFEAAEEDGSEELEEDDYLSLLNQISEDDPVSEDVKAISDLLSGTTVNTTKAMPSDVGEVFSDALKVVTNLNDEAELELQKKALESLEKKDVKNKKAARNKKAAKKEKESTEPKEGFFKKLFGNVKDKGTAAKTKANGTGEEATASAESVATKETAKKAKTKKPKKGAPAEEGAEKNNKKVKAAKAKELKKEKKENKKKSKEAIQVINDIEEDEGRINRKGASIVFLFFGLLAALILIGTNMASYTLSIKNATNYFERQRYTAAYNEVYGMDIEDEDIEIYDRIMTVMFVNKQLNSYNGYYSLGMYPEALDSLLKGLKRYDKYIELATLLGIKSDLDYVRNQILAELDNEFHLSEKEAMKIIAFEDRKDYSVEVYNVVLENMRH